MSEGQTRAALSLEELSFDESGLIPAVAQDTTTGEVLMLAYMNRESLERTLETGQAWFYSRSRQSLWHKGATSGDVLAVAWLRADCDGDAILLGVQPLGDGACHVPGERSCFFNSLADCTGDGSSFAVLGELARVIAHRERERPPGSYTTSLFEAGIRRIAQKVGEEGVEVALAAAAPNAEPADELAGEVADLVYHLLVLAAAADLPAAAVLRKLAERRGRGGSGVG